MMRARCLKIEPRSMKRVQLVEQFFRLGKFCIQGVYHGLRQLLFDVIETNSRNLPGAELVD